MEIPITQTKKWQKLQEELGEESFFVSEKTYQYLAILKSTPVGKYLFCPYGPIAIDSASFRNSLKSLKSLAKDQNAFFVRIEPVDKTFAKSLPPSSIKTKDIEPAETWVLDLGGNESDLLSKIPSRLLRYYKTAEKRGITIETSKDPSDIKYLIELQTALAKKKRIGTYSKTYYETELSQPFATLYLVRQNEAGVIAAGLVFDDEKIRYNLQGAQSDQGRNLHATGILTIQLIKDAKAKGLKKFDFWGIAPEGAGPDHPWSGFTKFKKTFSGYKVDHAGTYDIVLSRPKHRIYRIMRKFNQFLN